MMDPMVTNQEYEVLVVGAGPTGLLLANLLGQSSIKVLLVEKNLSRSPLPKAILLDDEGFRSLQAVGVADEVSKQSLMGYGARYYDVNGECFASISPGKENFAYPKRNSFLQPDLEKALEENLKRMSSVTILRGCSFDNLSQDSSLVLSSLFFQGKKLSVKSQILVGCDGGKSLVRKLLGIKFQGFGYENDWGVIDTKNDPDTDRFTKFFCDHKRPFVSIPAPSKGRRYEFKLMKGETKESVLEKTNLRDILSPYRKELEEKDIIRAAVYRFSAYVAEKFQKGRVFLAGDSCHLTPPFAGQGMNTGLRDAHNLAWKLKQFLKGNSSLQVLESYEEERKEKVSQMVELAVTLGDIVMPKTELDSKVMSTVWKLAKLIPEAKNYVQEMKFKPKPHYEKGIFLFPKRGDKKRKSAIGRMLPQPFAINSNKEKSLLDHFLGNNFSLVACGQKASFLLDHFEHRSLPLLSKILILKNLDSQKMKYLSRVTALSLCKENLDDESLDLFFKEDYLYLVRPDRYVFLEAHISDFEAQCERISSALCSFYKFD